MAENEKSIMIVQSGCSHCDDAKEVLSAKIAAGIIEIIPVESNRGTELATKYNVDSTPTILNGKEGNFQKCFLSGNGKQILCDDGTTKEL